MRKAMRAQIGLKVRRLARHIGGDCAYRKCHRPLIARKTKLNSGFRHRMDFRNNLASRWMDQGHGATMGQFGIAADSRAAARDRLESRR